MGETPLSPGRFILSSLFGPAVQVKILEILLKQAIEEQKEGKILWQNFSDIAKEAKVAKSSGKRILDQLKAAGFIEEKVVQTHAQNPPRMIRIRMEHPAIAELLFFYKKVRGFL